jgi:hypothetical protein
VETVVVRVGGGLVARWKMNRAMADGRRAAAREVEPVVVAIFHTEVEARLAAGRLQNDGIPARVTLDHLGGVSGGIAEAARVHVPRRHFDAAQAILSGSGTVD